MKNSLFLVLCLVFTAVFGQEKKAIPLKSSSTIPNNSVSMNALDVLQASKADEDRMNREILNFRTTDTATIIIPVVFHIVNQNPSSITDQVIIDALQDLNDAFGKSGAYSASVGADTKIRFCLAKKDPDGGLTNGITRTVSFFAESLNPKIEDTKLKNLVQWDPTRYINIWYVKSIELEIFPQFFCGKWIRSRAGGYATLPPNAGPTDGIVITAFKAQLAHEMGHYLGLYHTFEGLDCRNNDCTIDGDRVCDTPPDAAMGNAPAGCGSPFNSCTSDTLSGFTVDMPDQISNFMDYGNESCQNQFTQGQADRMRAVIATQRAGLLSDQCTPPCLANITAGFIRNNPYPTPGNAVTFTNSSTGAASYEWLVNGAVVATSANFTYTFNSTGKYKVTLIAYSSSTCYSNYTDYILVNCGVTARFYTDKGTVASKSGIYLDPVQFFNTTENATSFKWIVSSEAGMAEQLVSTSPDLTYTFTTPSTYYVKLVASNGSCSDTSLPFPVSVLDPTPDGVINVYNAVCVDQNKVRVSVYACNYSYATIPQKVPVSFYDADPRSATANKIATFILPDSIPGSCCNNYLTFTIDVGRRGLNTIFAVFNDNGTTKPLALPNTSVIEKDYVNNISAITNVAFGVTALPVTAILEYGDTLQLTAKAGPGGISSYTWSAPKNLSCTNCPSPFLIADSTTVKRVIARSNLGCTDTAYVDIKVPPYNDYRVAFNDVQCAGTDSLYVNFTIFNDFKRAVLPRGLSVSFYKGNPASGSALLLPPVFTLPDTIKAKQFTLNTFIKGFSAGDLYAVINDSGKALPVVLPNTLLLEKSYLNNTAFTAYSPEKVLILPSDTTVFTKEFVPLKLNTSIYNPLSTKWTTGTGYIFNCTTCPNPVVQVFDSSVVMAQTENRFGCILKGTAAINVFPPDMQVQILNTQCYSDNAALVTFSICMNNRYDTVYRNIPVSFYDGNPVTGNARLLQPVFYTPQMQPGECYTYSARITAPLSNQIYAVVNDKGSNSNEIPAKAYNETNFQNNISDTTYTPFRVSINPSDTFIQRLSSIVLNPQSEGGTLTSYLWKPAQFLSCTNCANPVATPQYTMQYEVLGRNENFCTDTAVIKVRTNISREVFIPDAFTPNKDQLNDIFYVLAGPDALTIKDFTIFNRWGQNIFKLQNVTPNNPAFGWNGKYNAQDVAPGTYVYYVTIAFADGNVKNYKGTVVLIR